MTDTNPDPGFQPSAPPERTASDRRRSLIAAGVGLVVVIFIFGFVLPSVIDYETVFDVLGSLEPQDYFIMLAAGLLLYIPEGALYASIMPGMGLRRGMSAWVGSTAVSTTIPGADLVVRYAYAEGRHRVDAPPGLEITLDAVGPQLPAIELR